MKPVQERGACEKRCQAEFFEKVSKNDVSSSSHCQPLGEFDCDSIATYEELNEPGDPLLVNISENTKKVFRHKVQVNIKVTQKDNKVQEIVRRNKLNDIESKLTDKCKAYLKSFISFILSHKISVLRKKTS